MSRISALGTSRSRCVPVCPGMSQCLLVCPGSRHSPCPPGAVPARAARRRCGRTRGLSRRRRAAGAAPCSGGGGGGARGAMADSASESDTDGGGGGTAGPLSGGGPGAGPGCGAAGGSGGSSGGGKAGGIVISPFRLEELTNRLASLQQENKVLKIELETYKLKCKALQEENRDLRKASVTIVSAGGAAPGPAGGDRGCPRRGVSAQGGPGPGRGLSAAPPAASRLAGTSHLGRARLSPRPGRGLRGTRTGGVAPRPSRPLRHREGTGSGTGEEPRRFPSPDPRGRLAPRGEAAPPARHARCPSGGGSGSGRAGERRCSAFP